MRVVVTGGAGYIGSVTAARLLDAGHEVTVIDDLRSGRVEAVPEGASFQPLAITDIAGIDSLLAGGVDAVLHFAASIEAGESMRHPEAFFRNNTAGTLYLLERLITAGVGRFVLSSTAAVYGDPETIPIPEDAPTRPTNAYGESKLLIERALGWLHRIHGLRYAALRYFNAAGAWGGLGEAHDPETHLVPLVLQVPLGRREAIDIFGTDYPTRDGTCVRDYIHVGDLASAHVLAVEALDRHPELVCNLGNGTGFSVREVIDAARLVTGHPIPARERDRRPGDPATLVASSERARELLGWRPESPDLADIVASAWEYHRGAR
jgi:UDP-glucose 4-epimerase